MARAIFAVLFAALLFAPAGAAERTRVLKPVDEASKDAAFLKFRTELIAAVEKKDEAALMKFVAADIRNSFGGDGGTAEFKETWHPEKADSPVWAALSLTLSLGGSFLSKTEFEAPYVASKFPESDSFDAFDVVVVVKDGAVMRAAAKADAAVVRTLDHDILNAPNGPSKFQHEATADDWVEVSDVARNKGFVLLSDVRTAVDYRATFERKGGKWKLASFLAGD